MMKDTPRGAAPETT